MTNTQTNEAVPTGAVSSSFHQGRKCTHDMRRCVECEKEFEGCSMQPKQCTCSKLCWNRYFRQGANDKRPRKRPPTPTAPGMKWCGGCKQLRSVHEFHVHNGEGRGLQYRCKPCQRSYYIARRYDMTPDQAERYTTASTCDLCGGPPLGKSKQLDIDHDHATGIVRGFLCNRCNKVLGYAQDSPVRLRAAADYLERH